MRAVAVLALAVLSLAACGDDEAPPSKIKRRDAAVRDAAIDAAEPPIVADAATDAGSGRSLTIRFRPKVGERDFDCAGSYRLPLLGAVVPNEFKFYVSEVKLIDRSGAEVPARLISRPPAQSAEVALIDFDDGT